MTVRSITQVHIILIIALASCTTTSLFYVIFSKNSLTPFGLEFSHDSENQVNLFFSRCSRNSFSASPQLFERKRMQRYAEFSNHANIYRTFFAKNEKFSHYFTIRKPYTLLYYIKRIVIRTLLQWILHPIPRVPTHPFHTDYTLPANRILPGHCNQVVCPYILFAYIVQR